MMAQLLVIREQLKNFYGRFENYCKPALKFILSLITLLMINGKIGYSSVLTNVAVALIIALLSSFLPMNFIVVVDAIIILMQLYALSLESVVVVGVLLLLMFLLYFRFASEDTVLLLFTPLCFALKIPYVIPLATGLISTPAAVVSAGCGAVVYYVLSYISDNASTLTSMGAEEMLVRFRFLIDAIIYNKEMLMVVAAFSVTIICVYLIRRLSVDHAWTIAIVTGALMNILIILIGDLKFNTYISIVGLIMGSIAGVLIVIVLKFFVFNVDYSRTEMVQFEDDEYYYYVKAVPKNSVSVTDKKVKKIKGQNKETSSSDATARRNSTMEKSEGDVPEYRVRRLATKAGGRRNDSTINGSNKNGTKRIILSDEEIGKDGIVPTTSRSSRPEHRVDSNGLTGIERAAAAKAKAEREERNKKGE